VSDGHLCPGNKEQITAIAETKDGYGLKLGRTRRAASAAMRLAKLQSQGGSCAFPGCDAKRYLHLHHIRPWYLGGRTDAANLVGLCGYHHRLVHEGGWNLTCGDHGSILVKAPGGHTFTRCGASGGLASGGVGCGRVDRAGQDGAVPTGSLQGTGEPMDLAYVLDCVIGKRDSPLSCEQARGELVG